VTTRPDTPTPAPDNPFAAREVGEIYRQGRPYHHPRTLARVLALVGESRVDHALDVACGTGMSTVALAAHADTVIGLDISAEMMRVAPPAANDAYMLGNAEQLPLTARSIDAVTCSSGIHWFDQARFFTELRRVVGPGGWIGLYDHYFLGMQGVEEFRAWVGELFARYPLPPRNPQVGDPRAETPAGFELVGTDLFEDPIEMTRAEFVDYQLSVSNCVAAAERGTPRSELRQWLLDSTAPLFGSSSTRVLQFIGTITCLRRAAD
jgi:ubiquinone/menaquinone biosynthesis C-methylase UbiE